MKDWSSGLKSRIAFLIVSLIRCSRSLLLPPLYDEKGTIAGDNLKSLFIQMYDRSKSVWEESFSFLSFFLFGSSETLHGAAVGF